MSANKNDIASMKYIRNTAGNATLAHFKDDFEPIGDRLWTSLTSKDFSTISPTGKVVLTEAGDKALNLALSYGG